MGRDENLKFKKISYGLWFLNLFDGILKAAILVEYPNLMGRATICKQ